MFRAILILALLALSSLPSHAQPAPAAPPGMTQEQFNALVDAISNAVTDEAQG